MSPALTFREAVDLAAYEVFAPELPPVDRVKLSQLHAAFLRLKGPREGFARAVERLFIEAGCESALERRRRTILESPMLRAEAGL